MQPAAALPPQRPGSCRRKRIPGRTANTSTANTIRPVRPSYPPPLRLQPTPPEAGRADTVGRSQLEGMQPAADRIRNPYTPPGPQECRRPEQLAGMGAGSQPPRPSQPTGSAGASAQPPPPDPPTSTASTPWILPENGDSWKDGRHLHPRHDTPCTVLSRSLHRRRLAGPQECRRPRSWPRRSSWPEPGREGA